MAQPLEWQSPDAWEVRDQVFALLDAKPVDSGARAEVQALWSDALPSASEEELLERVAHSYAIVDPRAAELVSIRSQSRGRQTVRLADLHRLAS